jgi:hypothetical protein
MLAFEDCSDAAAPEPAPDQVPPVDDACEQEVVYGGHRDYFPPSTARGDGAKALTAADHTPLDARSRRSPTAATRPLVHTGGRDG